MQTEYEFSLPRGLIDANGQVHHQGVMRLATSRDEIAALQDPRVQAQAAYLSVALLSRVIVKLGDGNLTANDLEGLFASDLAYLEDLYELLNAPSRVMLGTSCPQCSTTFKVQVAPLGASHV